MVDVDSEVRIGQGARSMTAAGRSVRGPERSTVKSYHLAHRPAHCEQFRMFSREFGRVRRSAWAWVPPQPVSELLGRVLPSGQGLGLEQGQGLALHLPP